MFRLILSHPQAVYNYVKRNAENMCNIIKKEDIRFVKNIIIIYYAIIIYKKIVLYYKPLLFLYVNNGLFINSCNAVRGIILTQIRAFNIIVYPFLGYIGLYDFTHLEDGLYDFTHLEDGLPETETCS